MKKYLVSVLVGLLTVSCQHQPEWQLVWEENFDGTELDTTVWSMIPRGKPDWQNTMSYDERCYEVGNGNLVLRGIVNGDFQEDPSPYLTGGVWTKGKKAFTRGRMEIRAKLQGVQGAWPAIWMLPADTDQWPDGGEVDIMERLNYDPFVYQTVHSHYTYTLGRDKNPPNGATAPIHPDDYNIYGVDLWPDSLVFHVNGVKTFTYPRVQDGKDGQFPFDVAQYLLIDMQLGGTWVGEVDPTGLPVEMVVDWVKHYQWK